MPAAELQATAPSTNLADATAIGRKVRGPSLNRRTGQSGSVFQHGFKTTWSPAAPAYGRYYLDIPGSPTRKRRIVTLGICSSRSIARRKLREHIEAEGINSKAAFTSTTAPAMTFRTQAAKWIASLPTRRRRPVRPATIFGWQHALDRWILPNIGDKLLAEISNGVLRELIEKMAVALSPKTIVNYSQVVKMVLASAVDAEGDQIYPRKWNHDFIGLPIVKKEEQHRPTLTEPEIGEILASSKGRYAVLFALLAGTGLRIGEALAVRSGSFSPDCRVLYVRRSIWHGQEQDPKTPNAIREIDIPESLALILRGYAAGKDGYIFSTKAGRTLSQRNVIRVLHDTGKKVGFHAFRRFRTETLRRARVPEDLIGLWIGHAQHTITDLYASGLQQDLAWRREWCDRVGLGFSLDRLHGLQNVVSIETAKAA
jgi:integrase